VILKMEMKGREGDASEERLTLFSRVPNRSHQAEAEARKEGGGVHHIRTQERNDISPALSFSFVTKASSPLSMSVCNLCDTFDDVRL